MGFLDGLGSLFRGEPVFKPPQPDTTRKSEGEQPAPAGQPASQPQQTGRKEFPEARIQEYVECREQGTDDMVVELRIRNHARDKLEVTKLEFMGMTRGLNQVLQPGQEFEIPAFNGDRPRTTGHSECRLHYKDASGDYFYSKHRVEFERLADGTYKVARVRFEDIHDE